MVRGTLLCAYIVYIDERDPVADGRPTDGYVAICPRKIKGNAARGEERCTFAWDLFEANPPDDVT